MKLFSFLLVALLYFNVANSKTQSFGELFNKKVIDKAHIERIKSLLNASPKKNIPVLFSVMKDKKQSEQSRWLATLLIGKALGKKSINYLSKFTSHPDVILRLASLKSLLSLEAKSKREVFEKALFDKSLLVRKEALRAVRLLRLKKSAPSLMKMLLDKNNYYVKNKKLKRSEIIKEVISTIGDLKYNNAKTMLLKLRSKNGYEDLYPSLDYALSRL